MLPIAIQSVLTSVSGFIDTIMASQIDCVSAIGTALQIDALMQGIAFGIAAGINIKFNKRFSQCFILDIACFHF